MTLPRRRRTRAARLALGASAMLALALLVPAAASAHAYLVHTTPAASGVLDSAPRQVALTYDEAVEPRFAIVSVTDPSGTQRAIGGPHRSPANPDTLIVPVDAHLQEGWYLVYWRAISVDGHPVQGAFTFAVGPNPGPAPQFPVPHVSATAITAPLLIARWVLFVSVMSAIGLLALRLLIARTVIRRAPGATLRTLNRAWAISAVVGLIAIPVYLDIAIANDSLRSAFDLGALVPLYRVTAFGRGFLDLLLCFALFCLAGGVALWVDRPERERRSVAELAASTGALVAAIAVLVIPGAVGHAGQASPRGLSMLFDAVHLGAGAIWLGGLIGLLVLWLSLTEHKPVGAPSRVQVLRVVVPRFSNVALASVLLLLATGIGATVIHMPALNALWKTGYGVAILVKIGLLVAAVSLAAGNLLRTRPGLLAAREEPPRAESAAQLLRRLISGEAAVIGSAVFAAVLLSSLAPPPPSFALQNSALAKVGPGQVARTVQHGAYRLQVVVAPNKAAAPDSFALRITKGGQPVRGANVTLAFNHLEMQMPQQEYQLREVAPGTYSRSAPALVMVGKWGLSFQVAPPGSPPFTALIVDQANG
ncbi:MAG: copper resistance protein CopC [Solirubrobacterales bacterium]|nr:copper resistance protein CopC [Solirubrobacterales bacterium]